MDEAERIADEAARALDDHKGIDIVKIDLREITNCFCRFFVICHGTSSAHVAGLVDNVGEVLEETLGEKPMHVEGMPQASWVLLDYGDVVVHVFREEQRAYYQLEDFWADARIVKLEENRSTRYGRQKE
ncbi:MAG: ribosome silencing factor [Odoribacteraceae bacterium]|jgi:ribosome-associated protein|nr:ribosome silencing factor [Odoribacteraceae bacterium]